MNCFKSTLALAASAMLLSAAALSAQEKPEVKKDTTVRPTYEINRFFDNIFVGVGGGINISETHGDNLGAASGRISPNINLYVGKWLTPAVGLRLGYNGLSGRGWSATSNHFATEAHDGYFKEKYGLSYLHGDVMWNVFNTFGGYKENRFWNMSPYLSAGWVNAYGNKTCDNELGVGIGIYNQFRVSKRVDITLDAHQLIANNRFTGSARMGAAGMTSISVGVAIRLGKTTSFKKVERPDYAPYNTRISDLQAANEKLSDKNAKLKACNDNLKKEVETLKAEKPETVSVFPQLTPAAVFFEIGKTKADSKQLFQLDFYVKNVIEQNPDKVFTITGYADKQTGSAARNRQLSEQRVEFIRDIMVNKYNISEDRLVIKAAGSAENRFDKPELNRCVVIE